jgi:hypothetical protein
MKKTLLSGAIVLLALGLAFTACQQPTDDSQPASGPRGLLGQIQGVVYDNLTNKPLSGVTVSTGDYTTTTNSAGAYTLKDVPPGTYNVLFSKDGYAGNSTAGTVTVLASDYDDSPHGKFLDDVLAALAAHAPTTGDNSVGGGTVSVNVGGETLELKSSNGFLYELDTPYRKTYNITAYSLAPLTGTLKGTIKLFTKSLAASTTAALDEAVNITSGVEILISSATAVFGPYRTGANGSFTADKLPANGQLNLSVKGFTQNLPNVAGTEYYFAPNSRGIVTPLPLIPLRSTKPPSPLL